MAAIKTDKQVSERLLNIDWGQPPSDRMPAVAAPDVRGMAVAVRIDEVFQNINAYQAMLGAGVPQESMLGRSLVAQANAIFNQACVNLEQRMGFSRVFVASPVHQPRDVDITPQVIDEVISLQRILNT